MQIITLITDYGGRDYYVGALKGVILSIAPKVTLVDVTHEVEPHNILHAAFVLRSIWPWFPAGTIHLVIVDPGVGTERRVLLGRYDGSYVVAPDNGVLSFLHRELRTEAMHVVEDPRFTLPHVSSTFEGRDVLAPVAAHLALGVKPRDFGRATDRVEVFPLPRSPGGQCSGVARTCALRGPLRHLDQQHQPGAPSWPSARTSASSRCWSTSPRSGRFARPSARCPPSSRWRLSAARSTWRSR